MSHPSVFSYTFTIPQNVIDENGHVNNVAYVQWMQDAAAIYHPEAVGYKLAENTTWYAREHRIEYLLPAFLGEELEVRTWISEIRRVRVHRKYEFIRKSDGKVIVRGETDWVYVEAKTGRPISIPEELQILFPVLADQTDSAASA
ncbi:MAG TPA: thioesterase family protein [Anaerolineales bacterium]|nr:thioesterase family protein [Anaerolineales bacterium]